jgi:drug/metabolite transporter (DMT)-like permease
MSLIFPIGASVLQAASYTLDKVTLSVKKVTYKTYLGISFPLIFFITLIIFFIFKPPLSLSLFSGRALYLMIISVILIIIANLIFYRTLKSEKISEVETISLLGQITLIIFTGFIFASERNFIIIFLALLSSFSVIWAHWRKDHFQIAKKTKLYLFWTLIISPFTMIITKILLETWNPISLELVRTGLVAVVFGPLFLRYEKKASFKAILLLIATNVLTAIAWILYFFSYQQFGIIQTVLIFSIQPLLVYFASIFLLKEKLHWKKLASFFIILASIIISRLIS